MSEYLINSSTLTGIANAIRSKTATIAAFTPNPIKHNTYDKLTIISLFLMRPPYTNSTLFVIVANIIIPISASDAPSIDNIR